LNMFPNPIVSAYVLTFNAFGSMSIHIDNIILYACMHAYVCLCVCV
jgi:hypothetical protein